jgi:serine-aspartate repeat-containing protein C/D/E
LSGTDAWACNAIIGDFVWEDLNANGIQDPGEPGIEGVTVNLVGPGPDCVCNTEDDVVVDTEVTDEDGYYLFPVVTPYNEWYRVQFVAPTDFEFTLPNQGDDDSRDSDVGPDNEGRTECVTLGPDEVNDTLDAGLFRRASLGDFVWQDLNRNGIQDGNEPGIPDVTVELSTCGPDGVCGTDDDVSSITSDTTDGNGLYLFDDLIPGDYCVKFEKPAGFNFTLRNAPVSTSENDSDAKDDGFTDCVNLESNEFDNTIDAGLLECKLSVEKFCSVPTQPKPFVCDDAKPIDSLTMIWDGSKEISEIAVYRDKLDPSDPGKNLMSTITGPIVQGDEVTADGYVAVDARNDVDWHILFTDGTDGVSRFHRSCSDDDMNGPEDCMKNEGNAKTTDPYFVNDWLFEGMAGNTLTLDCTPDPVDLKEECEVVGAKLGSCDDDKPTALVFEYTGAACSATTNFQDGEFKCEEIGSLGDLASVVMTKDADKIDVEIIGNMVKIFRSDTLGKEFPSEIKYLITDTDGNTQSQTLHTSCSKPLNVEDQFGSLILSNFIPKD